jgi:hypothetical integral membrane protein (TIGR02206 family)
MHPIQLFGTSHLLALAVTALVWLGLGFLVKWEHPWSRKAELALAVGLLAQWFLHALTATMLGFFDPVRSLPLHMCDIAAFFGGFALITKRQPLIDLTYFWGMVGTLQGLLTPNLQLDFPHPEYFRFFLLHSGVVIAALHMTISWRRYPTTTGLWKAYGWLAVYAVLAGTVNYLTGSNYAFLGARPSQPSIMDFLPDPPKHVIVLAGIGLVLFWLSYGLIVLVRRRAQAQR